MTMLRNKINVADGEGMLPAGVFARSGVPRHCAVAFWSWMTPGESQSEE